MTGRVRFAERMLGRRARLQLARVRHHLFFTLALIAAGVLATVALLVALGLSLPWQQPYTTRVAVENAAGVTPHSGVVRVAGVPVGTITSVELERGQPVLTIEMDEGPVFKDARAQIRPATPLNDMYLDFLSRGTPSAGVLGPKDILRPARTSQPVDISRVLNVFDADVRPRMRAMIIELGEALGDNGDDFRRTLAELAPFLTAAKRISDQVAERGRQTRRLVHNFNLMTREIGQRERQLAGLITGAGRTFEELGDRSSALSQMFVELPATLREMPPAFRALRRASDHLEPALRAMRPTARVLRGGLTSLSGLAPDIRSGSDALRRAAAPLSDLMRSADPLSADLGRSFSRLAPQLPRLQSSMADLEPCEKAMDAYLHYWMSIYKLYDDLGVLLHAQSTYTSSTTPAPELVLQAIKSCTNTEPQKG